jgi:hypothetical protein
LNIQRSPGRHIVDQNTPAGAPRSTVTSGSDLIFGFLVLIFNELEHFSKLGSWTA